ncbi:MAG: hypothetical protein JEZ11_22250 [Desulfobacterales bacterium]|nr:hypothetical protein [Desulfobacterales bacterium]
MTRPSMMTLLALTVCLCCNTAYGVDFVTKDRFKSEAGGYKDYPFRVLFQKLAQSQGEEKKKIRTAIIEKQVFDRNMQRRVEAGTVSYQRTYGVVREISEERLVLWDTQNETARTFHTGLLAIPTLNPGAHEVSSFNLTRFAVVVYSMDDRVYQLEIGFPMAVPKDLELSREGSRNLLQWAEPSKTPKPVGYRVLVGGALYQSIEGTAIRIPRKPDQAAEYTVRAVYRHGPVLVESAPSATVFDRATATEIAEKKQAEQAYALMLSTLNPASWESARRILNENLSVFSARLEERQQALALGLTRFFADIDEGDRMGRLQPETAEYLTRSLQYYEAAMEKGRHLAPTVDVAFIPSRKIQENQTRLARAASRNREMLARDTLEGILASLTPNTWEAARNRLLDQKALLTAQLAGTELATVNAMLAFVAEIDAGDVLARSAGASDDQLARAAEFYARARQQAAEASGVDATLTVIADGKNQALSDRIAVLRSQSRQAMARQVYDEVIADLTPDGWPEARNRLLSQRDLLLAGMDADRRITVEGLLRFFSDIDAGDRFSRMPAVTTEQMAQAAAFYQNARQAALALEPAVKVSFIADLKISEGKRIVDAMESRTQALLALETWERITMGLTPESWPEARQQLFDNREFLLTYLNAEAQAKVNRLMDFFASIDAGDRFAAMVPSTLAVLEKARASFQEAENKAGVLADTAAVGFIAQGKQQETAVRMQAIEAETQARLLQQEYQQVVADLTPARWLDARRRLDARRDAFLSQLPAVQQATVTGLLTFFSHIDSGDRLLGLATADAAGLAMANGFYEKAAQTAAGLTAFKGLDAIVRQKLLEGDRRMAALKQEDLQAQASLVFQRVRRDLTPTQWPEARQLLDDNRRLLEAHLLAEDLETLHLLGRFFAHIDAGDGIAGLASVSVEQMEQALGFYEKARQQARALAPGMAVGFIADMRFNQGKASLAAISDQKMQAQAGQTLDRILLELTPSGWTQARQMLMDNRDLLLTHGTIPHKETAQRLIAFFADIDAGDKFAATTPAVLADLERAHSFYGQARAKAEALADTASVAFIVAQRRSASARRIAAVRAETQSAEARQIFERALSDLNPARWTDGRATLDAHREMLETQLEGEQRAHFDRLMAFFSDIGRGDRFSSLTPPTTALLENALSAYGAAATQAEALSAVVDLSFLTQPKIETVKRKTGAILALQAKAHAEDLYGQIMDQLTPSQWTSARGLMATHGLLLQSTLDGEQRETMMALDRFFSEIEEGDRLGAIQPVTRANLKNAAMFYERADEKAAALPAAVDVRFLPKMRLNEIAGQLAVQKAYEQRLAEQADQQSGKPASRPRPTGKAAIKYALKDFNTGDYPMALQGFSQVYQKQIGMMRKKGMKRLQGVMGLPDKYRAEIVFLVELETLLAKSASKDQFAVEEALGALSDRILEGRGMWGIIPQDRRDKMANRLENIAFETQESG